MKRRTTGGPNPRRLHTLQRSTRLTRIEEQYRAQKIMPTPSRITLALDLKALDGPEVDIACLAVEPAVDEWEAGRAAPSWEQLVALAALTGFPVEFFLRDDVEEPAAAQVWLCSRGRGGCELVTPPAPVPPYDPSPMANVTPLHKATLW